jgi:hypothetical protein
MVAMAAQGSSVTIRTMATRGRQSISSLYEGRIRTEMCMQQQQWTHADQKMQINIYEVAREQFMGKQKAG